jgi:tRNA(fMet)-specific endonuclease VapC
MTRYLLDTNVLLHLVNKSQGHELIAHQLTTKNPQQLFISAITVWEISRMVEKRSAASPKAALAALRLMEQFQVMALDARSAAVGGNLHASLANRGATIGERDSMIAGIATVHEMDVITDNVKEFARVPGILVYNWRENVIRRI